MFIAALFTIPQLGAIMIYFLQERKETQRTDTAYRRPQSPLAEKAGPKPRQVGIRVDPLSPLLCCLLPMAWIGVSKWGRGC